MIITDWFVKLNGKGSSSAAVTDIIILYKPDVCITRKLSRFIPYPFPSLRGNH